MSELMTPIPFRQLMTWIITEYEREGSVFGVHSPSGRWQDPAHFRRDHRDALRPRRWPKHPAGPEHRRSYFGGARFFELKTVQKMDGAELAACINRPCILAEDECYNCEWSTELYVPQAFEEYVKAWCA